MSQFSEKKIRVALVYHFFAHYRAPILEELLRNDRFEFTLYGNTHDPAGSGIKAAENIVDQSCFVQTPILMLFKKVLLQKGLVGLAMRKDIRHIIYLGNPYYITTWISAIIARLFGKRVLFWTHGWRKQTRGIKCWIRNIFFRIGHGLLLYGNTARNIGIAYGFNPDKLYVIYNSLNYSEQKKLRNIISPENVKLIRTDMFDSPDKPLVASIGRLTKRPKLEALFDAASHLQASGHPVNILIIGDGPERKALEAYAKEKMLPVKFYGACYDEFWLAKLIGAANVVVTPGDVGLTAIHSLSFGTPVISHNNIDQQGPEFEAIIPGMTGDLFEQGNATNLARVVKDWTQTQFVEEQIRQNCFSVIDRYYNPSYQKWIVEQALTGVPASLISN